MRSFGELLSGMSHLLSRAGTTLFWMIYTTNGTDGRSIAEIRHSTDMHSRGAEFMRKLPFSAIGGIRYMDREDDLAIKKLYVKWLKEIIIRKSGVEYMLLVKDENFTMSDELRNELYIMLREKLSGLKVSEDESVVELRSSDDMGYLSLEEQALYEDRL